MSTPAGIIMPFAGTVSPHGCLFCDGSAVSRTTYSSLFAVIGTTYGEGDGSTTFNIPDISGRVVIGVSNSHALGTTGGSETVTLTTDQLPSHTHVVPQHGHGNDIEAKTPELAHSITQPAYTYNRAKIGSTSSGSKTVRSATGTYTATRSTNVEVETHDASDCTVAGSVEECPSFSSGSYGADGSHNNMQPYLSVRYVISTGE